jgi:alanyl-tRNA synthetase
MVRLSFLAGHRLLLDSRSLRQNAVTVSRALRVPLNEIGKGLLEYLEKTTLMEKRLKSFEEKATHDKTEALLNKIALLGKAQNARAPLIVIESYSEEDINEVLNIGKAAQKKCLAVLVLASEQNLKFAIFNSVKDFDIRPFIKNAFESQGGKGGGSPSFFQGSFSSKEALDAFLKFFTETQP